MWPASSASAPDDVAKSLLFRWRERLLSDDGPKKPIRRYVLLVLSTYGDQRGADIFPSTKEIARATGMSRRRVEGHLRHAESEHWISRASVGQGRGWRRMRYELVIPKVGTERPHDDPERGDGASQPLRRDVGTERPNRPPQRADVGDERGDDSDTNVGTERPITSVGPPHSTSPTTSPARAREREDGESLKEVVVPDAFDPADYGLDDKKELFARMTPNMHRRAASILERETEYPVAPGYSEISRSHELDQLPPHRLRELQHEAATNGEAP